MANELPVIDRHVLRGARVDHKVNSQRQVIDLQMRYPVLLERFREELSMTECASLYHRRYFGSPCFDKLRE
jgi:hypothetical protein